MLRRLEPAKHRRLEANSLDEALFRWLRWLRGAGRAESTVTAYATDAWQFLIWMQLEAGIDPDPSELTPARLQDFHAYLGHRGLSQATVCRKLGALSGFFKYLIRDGQMQANPLDAVPRSRPKNGRVVWMPEEEAQQVLDAIDDPLERSVFLTLYRTGLRKGELLQLRLDDVDLQEGMLTVEAQKTQSVRHVPLSAELITCLGDYLERRPACSHDAFFVTDARHVPLYSTLLQRWFTRWMTEAGLADKGYTIHTLRHSAATNWIRSGLHVAEVRHLLGHSSLETTSRYLHHAPDEIRAKVDRITFEEQESESSPKGEEQTDEVIDAQERIATQLADAAEAADAELIAALTKALQAVRAT